MDDESGASTRRERDEMPEEPGVCTEDALRTIISSWAGGRLAGQSVMISKYHSVNALPFTISRGVTRKRFLSS